MPPCVAFVEWRSRPARSWVSSEAHIGPASAAPTKAGACPSSISSKPSSSKGRPPAAYLAFEAAAARPWQNSICAPTYSCAPDIISVRPLAGRRSLTAVP